MLGHRLIRSFSTSGKVHTSSVSQLRQSRRAPLRCMRNVSAERDLAETRHRNNALLDAYGGRSSLEELETARQLPEYTCEVVRHLDVTVDVSLAERGKRPATLNPYINYFRDQDQRERTRTETKVRTAGRRSQNPASSLGSIFAVLIQDRPSFGSHGQMSSANYNTTPGMAPKYSTSTPSSSFKQEYFVDSLSPGQCTAPAIFPPQSHWHTHISDNSWRLNNLRYCGLSHRV
ncbi:hypothetical protein E4U43_007574 [Claviceps pusilla]|uniref:Uncharacterized protein n=1 Tax=Claviceps pusilla TaxID=123648 RepID=A0A9P7NJ04_9HYPO|nr:hypothetical protein E4U43_007574 [Claviceps pusilla]